jgi:hypothetical protein
MRVTVLRRYTALGLNRPAFIGLVAGYAVLAIPDAPMCNDASRIRQLASAASVGKLIACSHRPSRVLR